MHILSLALALTLTPTLVLTLTLTLTRTLTLTVTRTRTRAAANPHVGYKDPEAVAVSHRGLEPRLADPMIESP